MYTENIIEDDYESVSGGNKEGDSKNKNKKYNEPQLDQSSNKKNSDAEDGESDEADEESEDDE